MKIEVTPGSFLDPEIERLCRSRLAAVLARYTDLLRHVMVSTSGPDGVCVEVMFRPGVSLAVTQTELAGPDAITHLADRVGRAVARHVELRAAGYLGPDRPAK